MCGGSANYDFKIRTEEVNRWLISLLKAFFFSYYDTAIVIAAFLYLLVVAYTNDTSANSISQAIKKNSCL